MSSTDTSAFLPFVYKNAYNYTDIAEAAIVYKDSASSFNSLVGTADDANKVLMWTGTTWSLLAIGASSFPNVNSDYNGLMYNNGGDFYNIDGMSTDAIVYAIKYTAATSTFNGVAVNELALQTFATLPTPATGESGQYMIKIQEASGSYTYSLETTNFLDTPTITSNYGYMLTSSDAGLSWSNATPSLLYGVGITTSTIKFINPETSSFDDLEIPTSEGNYMLSISSDKVATFSISQAVSGFNYTISLSDTSNIGSDTTTIASAIDGDASYVSGVSYIIEGNFDVYVSDITQLVDSSVAGIDIVAKLPTITVSAGSDTLGVYIIKTNQPLQTIHFAKVITGSATLPAITAVVAYNGIPDPDPADGYIKFIAASAGVSMIPASK